MQHCGVGLLVEFFALKRSTRYRVRAF